MIAGLAYGPSHLLVQQPVLWAQSCSSTKAPRRQEKARQGQMREEANRARREQIRLAQGQPC